VVQPKPVADTTLAILGVMLNSEPLEESVRHFMFLLRTTVSAVPSQ
jgi:hypothetical protein